MLFYANGKRVEATYSRGHKWNLGYPLLLPDLNCQEYVLQTKEISSKNNYNVKNNSGYYNSLLSYNSLSSFSIYFHSELIKSQRKKRSS